MTLLNATDSKSPVASVVSRDAMPFYQPIQRHQAVDWF